MAKVTTMKRLADFSEWQMVEKRETELRGRLDAVERRIAGLHGEFTELSQGLRADDVQSKAQALLKGNVAPAELWTASQGEELSRLNQERIVLIRAIELHAATMYQLRARLSREACEAVRPQYEAQVAKLKDLVSAIGDLNDVLHQMHIDLEENGFSSTALTNAEFTAAGRSSNEYSRCNLYLKELSKLEY